MSTEVKEKHETKKSLAPIRANIKRGVHGRMKKYHLTKPRTELMEDTINELLDLGLKTLNR
jgi:hypothetical protein